MGYPPDARLRQTMCPSDGNTTAHQTREKAPRIPERHAEAIPHRTSTFLLTVSQISVTVEVERGRAGNKEGARVTH